MQYPILLDVHTHSIASGHISKDTITDMARAASNMSLRILGISDHGPASIGAGSVSYFRNLRYAEKERFHISLLYGVELNILNKNGDVDLGEDILSSLDYAFISMHHPTYESGTVQENTEAYIHAMRHTKVKFIGHPDDDRYPVDFEKLLVAAKERNVYPEINNASLMPDAYRKGGHKNSRTILALCKKLALPVLLSSDSHGKKHIADMSCILPLLEECSFPPYLVLNSSPELFQKTIISGKLQ